jgi:hypothetical protein
MNSIIDPNIIPEEDVPRLVARRTNRTEAWKDRWNTDVEAAVRWCQNIKWDNIRAGAEGKIKSWVDK